ncbi:LysM peptidoglycan-binding domain-containing protein [Paenibacillus albicereus]|uniref:LysM peptidoglycan-binding domain-containing protein n=1 Tax=Paenibacillus albicereus TaxID=2726185 RepID=A0A6H2GXC3_9BACL|nr:LysM peptidoglycan-binding domain-containing protein [Paenibacillus albicereus]QJC52074.1 LysM peptidoglycan-binding domain-containing protein [Paenibacillus albicereus]
MPSDMPETGFRSRSERKKKKNTTVINGVLAAGGLAIVLFALFFVMYPFDDDGKKLASGVPTASSPPSPAGSAEPAAPSPEPSASPLPSLAPSEEPDASSAPDAGAPEPSPSSSPDAAPTDKPAASAAPAKPTPKPRASSTRTYIVQEGDTLTSISVAQYGSKDYVSLIAEKNGIVFVNDMKPGDKLKLPPASSKPSSGGSGSPPTETNEIDYSKVKLPATYLVLPGDTFYRISVRFYGTGKHAELIAEKNGLDAEAGLKAGDSIIVPAKPAE